MARHVPLGPNQLQCVRVADLPTPFFRSRQMWCGSCGCEVWVCEAAVTNSPGHVPLCSQCQPAMEVGKHGQ